MILKLIKHTTYREEISDLFIELFTINAFTKRKAIPQQYKVTLSIKEIKKAVYETEIF